MTKGDHIFVHRGVYTHHGIDMGDGTVVDWPKGRRGEQNRGMIRRISFSLFSDGRAVWLREYSKCFDADTVVSRAASRVDEPGYGVLQNNCEHFATWCKTGRHHSEQVKNVKLGVVGSAGIGSSAGGGMGVVSAAGPVPGLAGEGTVAGLNALGSVLRAGPATGLVIVAAVPALVAVGVVRSILNDDKSLSPTEREARAAGRKASIGGALGGAAASVGAVAASGVPGLSGVGITTGLAAIGGGSVGLGLAAVVALPAFLTLAAGGVFYLLWRRRGSRRTVASCGSEL